MTVNLVIRFVIFTQGKEQTKIIFITEEGYIFDSQKLPRSRPLTCVTVHKEEAVVATADASGRIGVWRKRAPTGSEDSGRAGTFFPTYFHWHSLPVRALAWSPGDLI